MGDTFKKHKILFAIPQIPGANNDTPGNTKRTQFLHIQRPAAPPFRRNEPNPPPISSQPRWPKVSPDLSGNPICHRRGPVEDKKRETNPIPRTAGVSPAFPSPIMRNEPNSAYRWRLAGFPIPHYAKQTQFPYAQTKANSLCINGLHKIGDSYLFPHHPPPRTVDKAPVRARHAVPQQPIAKTQQPKNAKQTQFRPANRQKQTAKSQKIRNEPNPTPVMPKKQVLSAGMSI